MRISLSYGKIHSRLGVSSKVSGMEEEIDGLLRLVRQLLQECGESELPYGEELVLRKCLQVQNCTYKQMAAEEPYTAGVLKNYGANLCQRLNKVFRAQKVKKSNLHRLPDWLREQQARLGPSLTSSSPPSSLLLSPSSPSPPQAGFSCTREDANKICLEIQGSPLQNGPGKRIVCATGLSRRAQLELRYAIFDQLQHQFEYVIVCNAENYQRLEQLSAHVSSHVSYFPEEGPATQVLFQLLQRHCVLLIMESTDVLL